MDYLDYQLNQYYNELEIADKMENLGFTSYDEYANYLEEKESDAQIAQYEAYMGY